MSTDVDPSPDDLPREPSAYRPSIHFGQQASDAGTDRKRHLDGEIINGCIQKGSVQKIDSTTRFLQKTFDGVTYRLVVNKDRREVITGYPIAITTDVAVEGSRWTAAEIEDIQHFLNTDPRPD